MHESAVKKKRTRDSERLLVLLEMLRSRHDHPDAETCYRDMQKMVPGIGKSTVYRHLARLSREGSICELKTDSGPAKYDANLETHGHFHCLLCDKIWDIWPIEVKADFPGKIINGTYVANGYCQGCTN